MGQFAAPLMIMSTLMEAHGKHSAGRAAHADARQAAREEKAAGRDAQIRRNEDLLNDLARRRAVQGAGGGTPEGSFVTASERELELADQDLAAINAMTKSRVNRIRQQGRNARKQGSLGATASLLKGGVQTASLLK